MVYIILYYTDGSLDELLQTVYNIFYKIKLFWGYDLKKKLCYLCKVISSDDFTCTNVDFIP